MLRELNFTRLAAGKPGPRRVRNPLEGRGVLPRLAGCPGPVFGCVPGTRQMTCVEIPESGPFQCEEPACHAYKNVQD